MPQVQLNRKHGDRGKGNFAAPSIIIIFLWHFPGAN
jgi:hypothetical protein